MQAAHLVRERRLTYFAWMNAFMLHAEETDHTHTTRSAGEGGSHNGVNDKEGTDFVRSPSSGLTASQMSLTNAFPVRSAARMSSSFQLSRSTLRTLEMCVPSERWMPEQVMHRKATTWASWIPMVAQRGSGRTQREGRVKKTSEEIGRD